MYLVQGRALMPDDVETARLLLGQHRPVGAHHGAHRGADVCASALHQIHAVTWPCDRWRWATQVIAAAERGEVEAGLTACVRAPRERPRPAPACGRRA